MSVTRLPRIIQGGMGVAVSSWHLARTVSRTGELGVVSGTGLDIVVARRLQDGDPGGHIRRALAAFPVPSIADEVLEHYFIDGGRDRSQPYVAISRPSLTESLRAQRLQVVANFAEVWLAKEGHDGVVGINFLEKIQMTTPWTAYGAMLAGVDYVLMGAGIPAHVPKLLNELAVHSVSKYPVDVVDALPDEPYFVTIDPREVMGEELAPLARPTFLAIVANHVLAQYLARDEVTRPDGFVVEAPTAGGHNAPRAERSSSTTSVSRSTARATRSTRASSRPSGCRSGWPVRGARRTGCARRSRSARPASRSAPSSR